jgi:hypothetical protein
MPDHTTTGEPDRHPTGGDPYVIEHYGFPAAAVEPAAVPPRPAHPPAPHRTTPRRRGVLAVAALGLVLVSGVGGVAVASADPGPDGDRGRQGDAVTRIADQAGTRDGPRGFDGPGGRR